jgi:uncharacterized SAM-binding protein YcdF (DUF218 family)
VSGRSRPIPHAAAVVVLGSGLEGGRVSAVLAGRLDRAAAVHRAAAGGSPVLVLSGGAKAAGGPTEAAVMAAYLRSRGVPAEDLLLEERSTTTEENLAFSAALLTDRAVPPSFVVVTSDFHVCRVSALGRRLRLPVRVVAARTPLAVRIPAALREVRLSLGLYAGSALTRAGGRLRRWRAARRSAG